MAAARLPPATTRPFATRLARAASVQVGDYILNKNAEHISDYWSPVLQATEIDGWVFIQAGKADLAFGSDEMVQVCHNH